MAVTEEKKELNTDESRNREVNEDTLETVSGGTWDTNPNPSFTQVYRHQYETATCQYDKVGAACNYCESLQMERKEKKYPCPVCGSWKVRNYDPGFFYKMRVICFDCCAFKDKNGEEPW